jgi:ActR/RegA family two-component response regulator
METLPRVLIVEDELLDEYLLNLTSDQYVLAGTRRLEEALTTIEQQPFDVIVTDLQLFEHADGGMRVAQKAKEVDATTGVIIVTGIGREFAAQQAIRRLGVRDFLQKPVDFPTCRRRIHEAILDRRHRLEAIEAAGRGVFAPIRNPYTPGRSLSTGSEMFYGRDEVFDFIRNNLGRQPRSNHLTLIGPTRIGKTSILQQLAARLGDQFVPVYINCQGLGVDAGMPAFYLQISRTIYHALQTGRFDVSGIPLLSEKDLGSLPSITFTELFLPAVCEALGKVTLVLCLDEFEELHNKVQRGRLDAAVFDLLSDLMQTQEQIAFILTGTRCLEEWDENCWDGASLLSQTISRRIGLLTPEMARRLIEEPVAYCGMHYPPEVMELLLKTCGGHPYLTQLLCGVLVNQRNEQCRNEISPEDVQRAIATVIGEPQPGFFWHSLNLYQQAVLYMACQAVHSGRSITAEEIETQLEAAALPLHTWPERVSRRLHEMALYELLCEHIHPVAAHYTLAFDLLGAWVRRNITLDQLREKMQHE